MIRFTEITPIIVQPIQPIIDPIVIDPILPIGRPAPIITEPIYTLSLGTPIGRPALP